MSKTIIVGGYGPGISKAVAEKFGAEGFSVALVGRSADKLAAGVKALEAKGVKAAAVTADLGDPTGAREAVKQARAALGPITVLEWTAYNGGAGDLTTADTAAIRASLDAGITGFLAAVQEALPDLRKEKDAAILVTNGGLGYADPKVDAVGVQWNAMGLSVVNAAKHKLVGLLSQKLAPDKIYVGQVMVLGSVKGSAFDSGQATIEAAAVAGKFWDLYKARGEIRAEIG
ncbi:MAG TPA: SDR family NAD(P)-dependent oxidoreductase [Polyangia bacterium]|jgi:NAD(P)-dependent dehydrogenase (short-subunit alcohol dehydrogenase family)|nr:SDR family NAD(P)-dependent oxidoreductase [Polyangia bacterium]